ncbi:hypothetical protein F5X96DRAFT_204771 [Biscogniauxia mediterranea]|nr:hypothetical protein F5X96DRAFT_204771 [Biscogniauxia mediterranea]
MPPNSRHSIGEVTFPHWDKKDRVHKKKELGRIYGILGMLTPTRPAHDSNDPNRYYEDFFFREWAIFPSRHLGQFHDQCIGLTGFRNIPGVCFFVLGRVLLGNSSYHFGFFLFFCSFVSYSWEIGFLRFMLSLSFSFCPFFFLLLCSEARPLFQFWISCFLFFSLAYIVAGHGFSFSSLCVVPHVFLSNTAQAAVIMYSSWPSVPRLSQLAWEQKEPGVRSSFPSSLLCLGKRRF